MNERKDFKALVDKAMLIEGRNHMRPVIEKELLHYDILFALDKERLLDNLTFQGGTLLRLCYGAQRFSEDLDFAGGINFDKSNLIVYKCFRRTINVPMVPFTSQSISRPSSGIFSSAAFVSHIHIA